VIRIVILLRFSLETRAGLGGPDYEETVMQRFMSFDVYGKDIHRGYAMRPDEVSCISCSGVLGRGLEDQEEIEDISWCLRIGFDHAQSISSTPLQHQARHSAASSDRPPDGHP
jgi:hypothetical protein